MPHHYKNSKLIIDWLHRFFIKLKLLYHILLDIIFPWTCIICHQETDNPYPLCNSCFKQININYEFICPYCHRIITKPHQHYYKNKKLFINALGAASTYHNVILKRTIHAFKYKNLLTLSSPLSQLMIDFLQQSTFFSLLLKDNRVDMIVIPIPLNYRKKLKRGFNQAELIAKNISTYFCLSYNDQILVRVRNNIPQVNYNAIEKRFLNVRNIFAVTKNAKSLINKKIILLIDDVYTTGATLNEAARILKENGAKNIIGIVLAKG